jgi:hypothetical protein
MRTRVQEWFTEVTSEARDEGIMLRASDARLLCQVRTLRFFPGEGPRPQCEIVFP